MKKKMLYFNMVDFNELDYEISLLGNEKENVEISIVNGVPDSEFLKYAADADGIAVDYTQITDEIMGKLNRCQVIVRRGVGFDNIDLSAATKHGICISNVPEYCQPDVALHTISLFLSAVRFIPALNAQMQEQNGDFSEYKMHRIDGRTFGLVSFGSIPRSMLPVLKALGLNVIAWDPYIDEDNMASLGVGRKETLDELLNEADFVSVHVPLNDSTRNLISAEKMKLMKKGSFIFNTARGGIIDEDALAAEIKAGNIAGAGLDVIKDEDNFTSPLAGIDRAILTPHVAYYTEESSLELRRKSLEAICAVLLDKQPPVYLLNKDVLGKARFEQQ
jgi:D-3-phosphoglycerate dehydrogenase